MMKKHSSFSTRGQRADIGYLEINRMLPNRYADAVGPFVFLDHIAPRVQERLNKDGTEAHPHRGIATLTYILDGEDEHFDSAGNYARVHSGGIQWMNAGNGIIHDETLNYDSNSDTKIIHAFQFWINLPSEIKALKPSYLAIDAEDVPRRDLPDGQGWIKVIAGTFEDLKSVIPDYSKQFLYHINLTGGAGFTFDLPGELEVAAYLPELPGTINDEKFNAGEFIEFDRREGSIELKNDNQKAWDLILFGGRPYEEPIFAEGPFVMNSKLDIAIAYRDFYNGDYGKIDYEGQRSKKRRKRDPS